MVIAKVVVKDVVVAVAAMAAWAKDVAVVAVKVAEVEAAKAVAVEAAKVVVAEAAAWAASVACRTFVNCSSPTS